MDGQPGHIDQIKQTNEWLVNIVQYKRRTTMLRLSKERNGLLAIGDAGINNFL
ncbi:Uncharacterised protein [Yersinia similis]|nr:Uncharacterised protein [Yersinia similis]